MVPPAVSVVAGLFTFYLAGAEPSMVVDDYGRIAMATAQRAERAKHAEKLGLNARVVFMAEAVQGVQPTALPVTVELKQYAVAGEWPDSLVLRFTHPTLSELDSAIELAGSQGRYAGYFDRPSGRYYVSLNDTNETWRLTGELADGATVLELHSGGRAE